MNSITRRLTALFIVIVMVFCFVSCFGGDDSQTTTSSSGLYYGSDTQSTSDGGIQSMSNTIDSALSTIYLVTKPGGTIPTLITSGWNTTIPSTTAPPVVITETTTNFTLPTGSPTLPPVYSSVIPPTVPTVPTQNTSQTQSNTGENQTTASTGITVDTNKTEPPQASDSTTAPTESNSPVEKELIFYTSFIDYDDNFVMEFEGDGWSKKLKSASTKINLIVGDVTVNNIRVSVGAQLNSDGRIEVTLQTASAQLKAGDTVSFTLPGGLVRTSDGSYFNSSFSTSQVVPSGG